MLLCYLDDDGDDAVFLIEKEVVFVATAAAANGDGNGNGNGNCDGKDDGNDDGNDDDDNDTATAEFL